MSNFERCRSQRSVTRPLDGAYGRDEQIFGADNFRVPPMRKILLAGVATLLLATGAAHAAEKDGLEKYCGPNNERCDPSDALETPWQEPPPSRVTVTPPLPPGPPPLGWVYAPYTQCADPPRCSMGMVNVQADGLN